MQSSRTRLTCRAPNRFTPSTALWQQFVAPTHHHRRFASAAEATHPNGESNADPIQSRHDSRLRPSDDITQDGIQEATPGLIIRRSVSKRGASLGVKRTAAILKRQQALSQNRLESLKRPDALLTIARAAFDAQEDYKGVVVEPMVNPKPVKESSLPWCLSPEERKTKSAMDRLAVEMDKFTAYARPNRYDKIARSRVIEQVQRHTLKRLPHHTLEVFGSERTGIALATSDIDLRLVSPDQASEPALAKLPPPFGTRARRLRELQNLHKHFKSLDKFYVLAIVRHARYPLISLQDRTTGMDIQIVLSNDTSASREIMRHYMEVYPYLLSLFTVVKTIFDIRGLSDVFRGGFGSYSLFMMIVASIQQNPHLRDDAAGGLLNFLKFYRDFDTTKQGISIDPAELFDKEEIAPSVMNPKAKQKIKQGTAKPLPPYMLCLRDPADATNDLGRKGIAIKHVQATFKSLLIRLENDLQLKTRPTFLGPLVGPAFMLNHARREKLETEGKRLMYETQKSLASIAKAVREGRPVKGVASAAGSGTKVEKPATETAISGSAVDGQAVSETAAVQDAVETAVTDKTESGITVTEPAKIEAAITELAEPETAVIEPAEVEAAVTKPVESETAIAEPGESEAVVIEPTESETAIIEHAEVEAAVTEPAESEAVVIEAAESEAAVTEPASVDMGTTELASSETAAPEATVNPTTVEEETIEKPIGGEEAVDTAAKEPQENKEQTP